MVDFEELKERIGAAHLRQRLYFQAHHASRKIGKGLTFFHIENVEWLHVLIALMVKMVGFYGRGSRNTHDLEVVENEVRLESLPESFDGLRILQLTDMHLDINPSLTPVLIDKVKSLDYDLCVITGDFRAATFGQYDSCVRETEKVVRSLGKPVYGVLGNHDFVEMVPSLEAAGIRMLLNEVVPLERNGDKVYLAGVDDPHFYEADNLQKVVDQLPEDSASLLLSHSPEIYRNAAASGFDWVTCGHTHGGQICLPGGIPVLTNGNCPRRMASGKWRYRKLKGYTSRGTGCSGVPLRFCCRPEVTVHTFRRASDLGD